MMHVISAAAVVKIEDIPSEWNQPVCEEGLQAASSTMNIPLEQLTSTVAVELPETLNVGRIGPSQPQLPTQHQSVLRAKNSGPTGLVR